MTNPDRDLFRACLYVFFLFLFVSFLIVLICFGMQNDFSFVEGLGIGAIIGVMTAMLKDGWQFFYRKS